MEKQTVHIQGKVEWRYYRDPVSGRFVGACEALKIATEGESLAEFASMAVETLNLLLTDLVEENELEQFLFTQGWQILGPVPLRAVPTEFEIPMHMIPEDAHRDQTRAARQ